MKPVLCKAGQQLREQFDDIYDRDRRSDGWLSDYRHTLRVSDHNPDAKTGIVRAIDVDRDVVKGGKPDLMPDIANQLRLYAKADKSKRLAYLIFNGKIASPRMGWRWRKYRGVNPHNTHLHCSFTKAGDTDGSFFNIPMLGGTV
jgi:hypothetical protein